MRRVLCHVITGDSIQYNSKRGGEESLNIFHGVRERRERGERGGGEEEAG